MHELIFYPIGNGESCLIKLNNGKCIAFDYADLCDPSNPYDKRMPLKASFRQDIGWNGVAGVTGRKYVDVLAITHGDLDHIKRTSEHFWLMHATKYQSDDRIRINEMWVPAALITEEGVEDETRILRQEARHRLLNKTGIKVFSRPEALRNWLEKNGKRMEDYESMFVDAGTLVPGFTKETDGVEFFVHSPFAERTEDGILDRNSDCIIVQAVFLAGGRESKVLLTGDIANDNGELDRIVRITRFHGRDERLNWDVYDIPHHCSYLSLAGEKGDFKTVPTPEVDWLLKNSNRGSILVCCSNVIPMGTTTQPPHVEAYRTYQDYRKLVDGEIVVTMEHPSKNKPQRTIIEISGMGVKLRKSGGGFAAAAATGAVLPRAG